jgi:hypothetical protein
MEDKKIAWKINEGVLRWEKAFCRWPKKYSRQNWDPANGKKAICRELQVGSQQIPFCHEPRALSWVYLLAIGEKSILPWARLLAHVKKLVSGSGGFGGARCDSLLCALVWTHDKVLFFVMSPNPTHDKVYKFCDYNKWMKIFKWISKITKNKHNTCIKNEAKFQFECHFAYKCNPIPLKPMKLLQRCFNL